MSARSRRLLAAVAGLVVICVTAAALHQQEPTRHTFRIVLGLNDQKPADWSGQLSVSGGEVVLLRGWRFEEKDAVNDKTGWTCKTHEHVAGRWRYPTAPAQDKPNP